MYLQNLRRKKAATAGDLILYCVFIVLFRSKSLDYPIKLRQMRYFIGRLAPGAFYYKYFTSCGSFPTDKNYDTTPVIFNITMKKYVCKGHT